MFFLYQISQNRPLKQNNEFSLNINFIKIFKNDFIRHLYKVFLVLLSDKLPIFHLIPLFFVRPKFLEIYSECPHSKCRSDHLREFPTEKPSLP
ncbi:hypothetical protein BpHYR1_048845 [Brachionus plicatilis]|uniref:Uncharacterized protein n=1 Tax=Brachionus plicatilis TaxID=10195 RepID=A0A3M7SU13_BRAPC|nr:hypothetical protein BpHYR1_048845 [Brachionus plicatilis]